LSCFQQAAVNFHIDSFGRHTHRQASLQTRSCFNRYPHSISLELGLLLPLVALLWWLQRRRVPPGWLTATFLIWYGAQRFLTDFLRAYDETVGGLTGAQLLCIGMVAGGSLLALRLRRRRSGSAPERAIEGTVGS
jgi:prolipoprotein diacylglyceryltransferase